MFHYEIWALAQDNLTHTEGQGNPEADAFLIPSCDGFTESTDVADRARFATLKEAEDIAAAVTRSGKLGGWGLHRLSVVPVDVWAATEDVAQWLFHDLKLAPQPPKDEQITEVLTRTAIAKDRPSVWARLRTMTARHHWITGEN